MNRLCPQCLSSERDRALQIWLRDHPPTRSGARLLEVAPLGLLAPAARQLGYEYASVDLMSSMSLVRGDLCSLPFPTGSFDLVVCFHVLEHVDDDVAAVREISRVLTDDGAAVVVVPWNPDSALTDEDLAASPEERLRRFGQIDHVRMYGRDAAARLAAGDMHVDEVRWVASFGADEYRASALEGDDDRFWLFSPSR
ncbi:MAG: methyltransferase domain-containing protein [Actinobacteria bacterium]|nr:methyltransferase domain-containing protein [Actinomycetota bacterium]